LTRRKSPTTVLDDLYREFLEDQDSTEFVRHVAERYTVGTLERLVTSTRRERRRAAVLALGHLANYDSNAVLGRALRDSDRLTRSLAENSIRSLWMRDGDAADRRSLATIVRLNSSQQYKEAVRQATDLIEQSPELAEAWNQRAIGHYCLARYQESISDCQRALELNPFHFGAAGGMGQCYVQLDDLPSALQWFRKALALNPSLEGVRASVSYLERSLKRKK
jgi:tetratricopeptide (TPR) repeat protein